VETIEKLLKKIMITCALKIMRAFPLTLFMLTPIRIQIKTFSKHKTLILQNNKTFII